jgi:hypothetical protein
VFPGPPRLLTQLAVASESFVVASRLDVALREGQLARIRYRFGPEFYIAAKIQLCLAPICAKFRIGISMPQKNSSQTEGKAKSADDFRVSADPVVRPDAEQEEAMSAFGNAAGLPRVHAAPILFAIARDPRTIFTYWSIDWPAIFANTTPVDRQVHLRVYSADGIEEKSVAVEPMVANCSISVSRPNGPYHVEIGYYQPADVWNSIATSAEVTMPRDNFVEGADVDLATIPLHLSFQRLLDLFGVSKGDALAKTISRFQTGALRNEKGRPLGAKEQKILSAMDFSLPEIAAARRSFIGTSSDILRKRARWFLGFGSTSLARAFSDGS